MNNDPNNPLYPGYYYETSAEGHSLGDINYSRRAMIFGIAGAILSTIGLISFDTLIGAAIVLGYSGLVCSHQAKYASQQFVLSKYLSFVPFIALVGYFISLVFFAAGDSSGSQRFAIFTFFLVLTPGYLVGVIFTFFLSMYMKKKDSKKNQVPTTSSKYLGALQIIGIIAFALLSFYILPFFALLLLAAGQS